MHEQNAHTHVGIVMGSRSEWHTIQHTANTLAKLGISYDVRIVTVNRSTNQLNDYADNANDRGLEVIIASLGGAAPLPSILANKTEIPILGVPVQTQPSNSKKTKQSRSNSHETRFINPLTTGKTGAENVAILAASILSETYPTIRKALTVFRHQQQSEKSFQSNSRNVA